MSATVPQGVEPSEEVDFDPKKCQSWCEDHTGFDDGSDDWHKSADAETEHTKFYISTGTRTGAPEIFVVDMPTEGMPLSEVRALAALLTAACDAAEAPEEVER